MLCCADVRGARVHRVLTTSMVQILIVLLMFNVVRVNIFPPMILFLYWRRSRKGLHDGTTGKGGGGMEHAFAQVKYLSLKSS